MSDPNFSKPVTKTLRLSYNYPENLESKFATEVIVQHHKDFVSLSFFETIMPPILGATPEEKRKELDKLESAEAKCISRIILTPEKFKSLLRAMKENLENFERDFNIKKQEGNN